MADNEDMKEIVAGMIDRDMLIRWTLEAKDKRIEALEQLADEAARLIKKYHDVIESLTGLAFATQEPNLVVIETWQEQYKRLVEKR